jgi:hypothetical protein
MLNAVGYLGGTAIASDIRGSEHHAHTSTLPQKVRNYFTQNRLGSEIRKLNGFYLVLANTKVVSELHKTYLGRRIIIMQVKKQGCSELIGDRWCDFCSCILAREDSMSEPLRRLRHPLAKTTIDLWSS